MTTATLRHLGNDKADELVLYLQDESPDSEEANHHIGCNVRCHSYDAGIVAGRMPAILEEARNHTLNQAFAALRGEMRLSMWEHVVRTVLAAEAADDRAKDGT